MKKLYLLFFLFLSYNVLFAQTTETYETEAVGSASFTDNGQVFNITSQAPAIFDVYSFTGGGWNGTGIDNRFIDNSGSTYFNTPVEFTISSAGGTPFQLKSMYLFLSQSNLSLNVTGSVTITGKLAGVTQFTATANSPFNTSMAVNNGFTLFNMSTYGGQNNSSIFIDQFVISTTGNIAYVALDALTWQANPCPTISSTGSQTNVSCNGGANGTATVVPSGGTLPYTYSWSPSGGTGATTTGRPAGNYTVTITDANGCTGTRTFTITQPSALSVATAKADVSCFGGANGAAAVSVSGGTAPYTYSWSPSGGTGSVAAGLAAGNYTITITDANACQTTRNFTINQPSSPVSGTTVVTNVACNGGSTGAINLTPSGGTAPYTFNWGGGITTEDRTGLATGNYSVTITDNNGCQTVVNATVAQPATTISGTTVVTNVACNGAANGAINLTPSGGTGPYTFNWGGGITTEDRTGLAAGTYSVIITDANGCTGTVPVTVSQPVTTISGTTVVTDAVCNGGTNGAINLTPSGGTGPYTFNWGGGITTEDRTGLAAGTYTVTITDANGCTGIVNATVAQPVVAVSGTTVVTNVACNGGTNGAINLTPTGGTGPYTFIWNGGATTEDRTGLAAGNYTVTITDANGCTGIVSTTVAQPTVLNATALAQTNIACNGGSTGSATVAVTGGTPGYTYSWSPSGGTAATATGLAAGTYTVTVTDANGCTDTQSFTITQPVALVATAGAQTNISCNGGSNGSATVAVTGGTPGYTYSWAPSGGTAATATGLAAGTYTVMVTDANGCTTTQSFTLTQPPALVATAGAQTNISCNGGSNGSATVAVTGGTGAYTYSWAPSGGTAATATGLAAGNYTVTVTDANGCQATQSFTITQPAALVATAGAQTNISCNGGANGSATVNVAGGTGAYTYSWAPSGGTAATATGLEAGTYTVTVTDANGCTATQSFTITVGTPATTIYSQNFEGTYPWGMSTNALNGTSHVWQERTSGNPTGGTGKYASADSDFSCSTAWDTELVSPVLDFSAYSNVVLTFDSYFQDFVGYGEIWVDVSTNGGTNWITEYTATNDMSPGAITVDLGDYSLMPNVMVRWRYSDNGDGCAWYWHIDNILIKNNGADPLIATAAAQTDVNCNGASTGSATVAVTGGTPGYTYLWSPSGGTAATATGLAAGTYTVTVTDANGCNDTQSFTITQPATAVSGTTVVTNVACNGGSTGAINLTPTGGTGPYTFNWGGGITTEDMTGLTAGNYSVVITDANGCTGTVNATVTQPAILNATALAQTNIACNGGSTGSATVAVAGGTPGYTYSWSPSGGTAATATGLAAGTYTVTVTDANGCTATQSFMITQPSALIATAASQTNISCNGGSNGSATVNVTGATGAYTYSWAPSGGTAATATGLAAGTYIVTVTDANGCTATQSFTITQPTTLIATAGTQTNISCNGGANGSATVNVTGGTGAYTYSWAPAGGTAATATGLAAGTYTVTVTDANGCTATQSFTITQPSALIATAGTQTNISCNGGANGSATVNVTGGTGAYTYSWAPSGGTAATATGLAAGTYTVTVTDANGCTATQSFTITQPSALVATAGTQTNISCNGGANGSATVNVTGGTGTYTYSWAPSGGTAATATGLAAGNYTVTVTDANGCQATQSFTITQPAALVATAGTQTNISCNGGANGSATVNVTGGTGVYTYSWAPSGGTGATATGLAAGTYTVTVTDANGCTATQSFTITQPSALVATAGTQTNISCNGGANGSATVNVTGGTGTYTYSWAPSGGTGATATGLAAGTYTVTVTDANGCTDTQSFTITQPVALVATAGAQTNISCNGGANGSATVNVIGGTGAYTYSWAPAGGTGATATGLAAGTYTVTVMDANGCTATQSFTITQPSALVATAGAQTNISCNGGANGSATVAVTGGTGTYTYSWAPSGGTAATATGLAAGTYTVTVTDANGCQATQSFTITQPAALVATAGTQTNISCNGGANGSATVAVTGGTGAYTYSWAPSGGTGATATGLASGTYTVTVMDANGCTATQSFTITQPPALVATAGAQTNISCNGGSNGSATVAVTGGTGAYTYSWAPSGGTAATATGLAAGNYTVTVTDANGCTTTQSFTLTQPPALVATAGTQTNISCNGGANGSATVNVTGGTGTYTYSWAPAGGTGATATGLAAGTYTVTVTDANGCTATQSFTITQPAALVATMTSTNVTCPGGSDGTATATVTGGTGVYIYSWSPSGGTGATATSLAAGTYTVTITDANGCTVTESVEVITTPDVTAPLADVANLPAITNYCSVLVDEIAIPTATDNCSGTITATTTDALEYTSEGSYTITWSYDDGNGNTATQTQTINVLASPLDQVTFDDATFVYNTGVQTIEVENLPAGATVDYSTTPVTGTDNGAVNAGVYTVMATLTPPAEAFNCEPVTLTATLTIDRAPQVIVFDPIPVMNLESDPDFQLGATATSGLPVYYTYTYTAPQPPATVTPEGFVDMLTSGEVLITAHQDGNENYLPADSVTQLLIIESSNASIATIIVGGQTYDNPSGEIYHLIECADSSESVDVTIVTEANATVVPGHQFTIDTPVPGIYTQEVTVTSQDGTVTNTYTIIVEKRFNFFDIVEQKFDNVLLVNNNPSTNGGYQFVAYQWYRNDQLIGTGQYYSAGDDITDLLSPDAYYYVRMTTVDGDVLQTCVAQIELEHFASRLYPNPAEAGRFITVEADFPRQELEQMQISIYSLTGSLVSTVRSSLRATEIQLPAALEDGTYIVLLETPNIKKSLKVIVRK